MREKFNSLKAKLKNEKNAIGKVQKLREEIESVNSLIETVERKYDLNEAAKLKYGRLPEFLKELEKEESSQKQPTSTLLRDKVTEIGIAEIAERWSGIPVSRLMTGEKKKLLNLEEILHERVI